MDLFDKLFLSIYIPSFRNAINVGGNGEYFDISIGENFINTWHNWKVGANNWQSQKIENITNDIKELFGYKDLQINASTQLKTLQLVINGKVHKLHEIGSGIAQFILVFASAALKQPSFILIDEPELNLHPTLQQKFLIGLASYTKDGIMFATHSIGLARSIGDHIYSVVKSNEFSSVKLFEKTANYNYAEFLGELSFSTYQELGVNKILLVEGPTEIKTIQQFLRKIKKDKDFVLLPLGGHGMINAKREMELTEIKRITTEIHCWIDSEKDSKETLLSTNRQGFLDICKKVGINAHASEKRAIENYFTDEAIKKVKGGDVNSLAPYDKLDQSRYWTKEENWRIAQEMKLEDFKNTDLGRFLLSI